MTWLRGKALPKLHRRTVDLRGYSSIQFMHSELSLSSPASGEK